MQDVLMDVSNVFMGNIAWGWLPFAY